MQITTTRGQIFLVEVNDPREKLEIQFVPEFLPIKRTANLTPVYVVNRNNPRQHFTGGQESLTLRLDFYADDENKMDVVNKVNWLLSLTYDDASLVQLVWGKLYKKHVWRVASVTPTYSYFWPDKGMMPGQANVDLSLLLDPITDLRRNDIRRIKA